MVRSEVVDPRNHPRPRRTHPLAEPTHLPLTVIGEMRGRRVRCGNWGPSIANSSMRRRRRRQRRSPTLTAFSGTPTPRTFSYILNGWKLNRREKSVTIVAECVVRLESYCRRNCHGNRETTLIYEYTSSQYQSSINFFINFCCETSWFLKITPNSKELHEKAIFWEMYCHAGTQPL